MKKLHLFIAIFCILTATAQTLDEEIPAVSKLDFIENNWVLDMSLDQLVKADSISLISLVSIDNKHLKAKRVVNRILTDKDFNEHSTKFYFKSNNHLKVVEFDNVSDKKSTTKAKWAYSSKDRILSFILPDNKTLSFGFASNMNGDLQINLADADNVDVIIKKISFKKVAA